MGDRIHECRYCGERVQPPTEVMGIRVDQGFKDPKISFTFACTECVKERKAAGKRIRAIVCDRVCT